MKKIKRALISLSNKDNLKKLLSTLAKYKIELKSGKESVNEIYNNMCTYNDYLKLVKHCDGKFDLLYISYVFTKVIATQLNFEIFEFRIDASKNGPKTHLNYLKQSETIRKWSESNSKMVRKQYETDPSNR